PERFSHPYAAEPQHDDEETVPPAVAHPEQRLDLFAPQRHRAAGPPGTLDMTGPGPIAKTRALGTQLGGEATVVADLAEQGEHGGIQRALSHGVLVELAHGGEDVVDPPGAARPALPGTGALDRRGP